MQACADATRSPTPLTSPPASAWARSPKQDRTSTLADEDSTMSGRREHPRRTADLVTENAKQFPVPVSVTNRS